MHNSVGRAVAQLGTFSGTITLAEPNDIPHGGSPRNQNVDYKVGSVYTRAGLVNPFVFENGSAGPNAGGSVSGSGWSNPNALLNGSGYASAAIDPETLTVSAVEVLLSSGQYFAVVTFTSAVPAWASGQTYTFSGLTTYTALNGQTLPVYAGSGVPTLTAEQQAFVFGSTAYGPASDTGSGAVSGIWEPTGILELEQFGFSISPTSTPQGFELTVLAYATGAGATLNFQMLKAGTPVGDVRSVPLTTESQQLPLGSINDLFGEAWTYADLNNTAFGVEVWATGTAAVTVYASLVTLQPWFTPEQVNFNYATTFEDSWGDIYTMALDANGNWWIEDVLVNSPDGTQSGSAVPSSGVAASVTAIPGSVASIGTGMPWANATGAVATDTGGGTAAITGYSSDGSNLTFEAVNSFAVGVPVSISGLSTGTQFNGITGPVISATTSAFSIALPGNTIGATSDSGTATSLGDYASAAAGALTAPVTVPSGQCVAWTFPTAVTYPNPSFTISGCLGSGGPYSGSAYGNSGGGEVALNGSGSTCTNHASVQWGSFAVPTLPSDAVIQAIYPVIISQGNATDVIHTLSWGVGSLTGNYAGFPGDAGAYGPGQWSSGSSPASIGNTQADITGAIVEVSEANSTGGIGYPDFDKITAIALAVYYTTTQSCPSGIQTLAATDLGLDIPLTATITGISVSLNAGDSGTSSLTAQLTLNGTPVGNTKAVTLGAWPQAQTLGPDLWGASFGPGVINGSSGLGVQFVGTTAGLIDVNAVTFTVTYTTGPQPPTLLPLETVPHGLFASSFTASSRQYIALSDLLQGDWQPAQFTGNWWDRVSQVGPGAPPQFQPVYASGDQFAIEASPTGLTQPAAKSQGSSYFLQSSGPGSTSPGSVITFYYLDATVASGPDQTLVDAFYAGQANGSPLYVYASFSGTPVAFPATVVQVTGVGEAQPPGQPRKFYYFQFNVPSTAYTYYQGSGNPGYTAHYQITQVTMTMDEPVPGLIVGSQATISGATPSGYNNLWTIAQTPNSGSYTINETVVSGGVATYSYTLINGTAPAATELVTVTGTNNGDGHLNVTNATIVSASGGDIGTFTLNVSLPDYGATVEEGQATTAGTQFNFDPGAALVGSTTNPIIGTGGGGDLTFAGSGQFVTPGTRKGTVFFITRNGYWTAPAPLIPTATFAAAGDNITGIQVSNIPIGPPNVIARAIAFTEAGANGVPGASFYTIPEPVQYVVDNVPYTASSLFINDNTTTSATFLFNDAVLLNADEIDVSGNDLFALGELGEAAWCVQYAGRGVWGRVRNKIQNFLNLSFDGGYLANSGSTLLPLGWNVNTATVVAVGNPTLVESAVFGNAYYIQNQGLTLAITNTAATGGVGTYTYTATASGNNPAVGNTVTVTGTTNGSGAFNVTNAAITGVNAGAHTFTIALTGSYSSSAETGQATAYGSTFPALGMIYQSAYQDWELTAILQNQTAYSVRVVCRTPSSATSGALVIDLTAWDANVGFGSTYGTFTLPLAQMTSAFAVYQGTLLLSSTLNIPSDLQLRVWAQNLGPGADLEIDHISVFPTTAPTNLTGLSVSYQDDWESFDLTSGGLDTSTLNAQPANGGFVMHDTLYIVKESSLGYFKDTPNEEPASWQPFQEVSNVAGASGINAWDVGEEWAVMACQNGLFLFNGGQPVPIQLEVPDIWAAINWQYGHTICVRNDVANRRILCAIPLPTPNPWMVDATENSAPTEPNVILTLNYKGIGTIDELIAAAPMHITMMGDMAVHDLRRKWSLWTIPTPYMGMVKRNELLALMMICNGIASSKIYYLDSTVAGYDDGTPFTSSYCMYGFVDAKEAEQNPIFGQFNKRYAYWDSILTGQGTAALTFYQNTLAAPYPFTVPGGVTLTPAAANDLEGPLNAFAQRLFPEIVMGEGWFSLSRFSLLAAKDRWSVVRGK